MCMCALLAHTHLKQLTKLCTTGFEFHLTEVSDTQFWMGVCVCVHVKWCVASGFKDGSAVSSRGIVEFCRLRDRIPVPTGAVFCEALQFSFTEIYSEA